jgi:hypothetical protein
MVQAERLLSIMVYFICSSNGGAVVVLAIEAEVIERAAADGLIS